ncbi:MAG: hypothetical protein U0169_27375 [Polyangiaceae bacterium]
MTFPSSRSLRSFALVSFLSAAACGGSDPTDIDAAKTVKALQERSGQRSLTVNLTMPPVADIGHRDLSSVEPEVRLFAIDPGCTVDAFETLGSCRKSEADPLGVMFMQYEATCRTPSGTSVISDGSFFDEAEAFRRSFNKAPENAGAFDGCMTPDRLRAQASQLCEFSACRRLVQTRATTGHSVTFEGLSAGEYFADVATATVAEGYDSVGYTLPAFRVDLRDGSQSVSKDVERYRLIVHVAR